MAGRRVRSCALTLAMLAAAPAHAEAFLGGGDELPKLFPLLFLTLGPFKLIAPFYLATRELPPARQTRVALLAALFACAMLAFAGALGDEMLAKYGIPLPILALAGGLILSLAALLSVLRQLSESGPVPRPPAAQAPTLVRLAMTPVAYPGIVTPYGVAALVVFLALTPEAEGRLEIAEVVAGLMTLNFVVMIATRWLMPALGVFLQIIGAVLGVVQVALGLQIMQVSLQALLKV